VAACCHDSHESCGIHLENGDTADYRRSHGQSDNYDCDSQLSPQQNVTPVMALSVLDVTAAFTVDRYGHWLQLLSRQLTITNVMAATSRHL